MTAPSDDILDLLTAYALDALEPEEISHVHALLASHPELRATLAELRTTVDTLPYGLPEANPAPELRQRVLEYATGRSDRTPAASTGRPGRRRGWLLSLSGVAAAAVVTAAIGWGQVVSLRGELAQARTDLTQAQTELSQTRTQLARTREDLGTAQAVIATLHGTNGQGTVVLTSAGNAVLTVQLPALPPGRTYQLWRMHESRDPLSAGLFTTDQQGYVTFNLDQQPENGETVAVTVEPDGGSPGPTSDPLIIGPVQRT
jgi:anti-sigma-K factor RskA